MRIPKVNGTVIRRVPRSMAFPIVVNPEETVLAASSKIPEELSELDRELPDVEEDLGSADRAGKAGLRADVVGFEDVAAAAD